MTLALVFAIAIVGLLCWLLFSFAVYALPLFAGVAAGTLAYQSGAGWLGAIGVGAVCAGAVMIAGHFALTYLRPTWARIAVALLFAAPAAIAGFHAVHGIVKHAVPSEAWQLAFSIVGGLAVGLTACTRLAVMAPRGYAATVTPN